MGPEFLAAKEATILLKRDPSKYIKGVVGMYLLSFYGVEGRLFRSAYYFTRHIDDVLDGDRRIDCNPLTYVQELRSQVETGHYKKGLGIQALAKYAVEQLERRKRDRDEPRLDFLHAIDELIFDYKRSKERKVLTKQELDDYYFRSFDPVVNLSLMILGSPLRARDIPVMSYGQGNVYSIRDFNDDWTKGILNVPKEVLVQAGLAGESSVEEVKRSAKAQAWFDSVIISLKPELIEVQKQLQAYGEPTNFIFGGLTKNMLKFIDHYEREI